MELRDFVVSSVWLQGAASDAGTDFLQCLLRRRKQRQASSVSAETLSGEGTASTIAHRSHVSTSLLVPRCGVRDPCSLDPSPQPTRDPIAKATSPRFGSNRVIVNIQ
jgi:hypothetical protein